MDSLQTSSETEEKSNVKNVEVSEKYENSEISVAKLEALVTQEQMFSASVARKRRNLSKKNFNSRTREQTPGRDVANGDTSDENGEKARPRTPERKRKRNGKNGLSVSVDRSESLKSRDELKNGILSHAPSLVSREGISNQDDKRKLSLVSITQQEVVSLFNRAKRSLAQSKSKIRQKKFDKPASKRSQSVPSQFTEQDLIDGLRKANLIDYTNNAAQKLPQNDWSDDSSLLEEVVKPKPYRPIVQAYVAKKKQRRQSSSKIIEVLDPKTSKVIKKITKGPPPPKLKFVDFLRILKYFTILEIYRLYQKFKKDNRLECERIRKLRNRCVCDIMIIMIFCGLGAILFKNIEGAFENFYKCGVKRVKRDFIDVLWYRSHNMREDEWKSLARNKLRNFEEELHVAHEAGMRSYSGQRSWSFLNGILYCLTLVTTIGYGHICPNTNTGRALTVVYALIGIPLFLIALTDFGKLFTRGIKFLWSFVRRLYYTGNCRRVRQTANVEGILQGAQIVYEIATLRRPSMFTAALEVDPESLKDNQLATPAVGSDAPTTPAPSNYEIDDEFNLPISVAIFILVVYIFMGAVMYWILESEWDFFASFYFVFISMSTIGFGDYVPEHPVSLTVSIVYFVFGLALMSMCINVVQLKLSDTFKDASSKLGATMGLNVNEDDGSITTVAPTPVEVPEIHSSLGKNDTNGKVKITDDNTKEEKKSNLKASRSKEEIGAEIGEVAKPQKEVKF